LAEECIEFVEECIEFVEECIEFGKQVDLHIERIDSLVLGFLGNNIHRD
jgi:hypothetical protein